MILLLCSCICWFYIYKPSVLEKGLLLSLKGFLGGIHSFMQISGNQHTYWDVGLKWAPDGKAGLAHLFWALLSATAQATSYCLWASSEFLSEHHKDLEHPAVFVGSLQCVGGLSDLWWTYATLPTGWNYSVMIHTFPWKTHTHTHTPTHTHTHKHKYTAYRGTLSFTLYAIELYKHKSHTEAQTHMRWLE